MIKSNLEFLRALAFLFTVYTIHAEILGRYSPTPKPYLNLLVNDVFGVERLGVSHFQMGEISL